MALASDAANDSFETVAVTWSQPEATVMLSMFDFYGIPAFAVGRQHASVQGPMMTALQGIQIRVASDSADEALELLAEVAQRPAAVRPYAFGLPGLYRIIVILAVAMAIAIMFVDPDDETATMIFVLASPLMLVFAGAPPPRTPSTFMLWKRRAPA